MHRAKNLVKHVQNRRIDEILVNSEQNAQDQDLAAFGYNINRIARKHVQNEIP